MTITLVAIHGKDHEFCEVSFIREVAEKHSEELEPLFQAKASFKEVHLKLANLVRNELTVFQIKEESEQFIPDTIIEQGSDYFLHSKLRVEGEKVALYTRSESLAAFYTSSMRSPIRKYLYHSCIDLS